MSQSALDSLIRGTRAAVRTLAQQTAAGTLSPRQFGDRMADLLEEAHTRAVVIGRQHAGDTADEEADDRTFGSAAVDGEAEYLAGFIEDLEAGRYLNEAGEVSVAGIEARANLYAEKVGGTAGEALLLAAGDEERWEWRLGAAEQSCSDCPERAAGGPYTTAELLAMGPPRSGSTECVSNCRCVTSSVSVAGFAPTE